MGLFSPDRRRLTIASSMTLLGAILHTIGNPGPPPDPGLVDLRTAMQNYHIALGLGMSPSTWDIQRTLVFTMSICVAAIAWLGFAVAGSASAPPRMIVGVSRIGLVISGALTALCFYYPRAAATDHVRGDHDLLPVRRAPASDELGPQMTQITQTGGWSNATRILTPRCATP